MSDAYLTLATVVAPLLAVSGGAKLAALDDAPRAVGALRLRVRYPRAAVAAVSLVEIALATALVSADGMPRVVATGATAALMVVFTLIVLRAVRHGSTDDCGCAGRVVEMPLSRALVHRNIALCGVSGLLVGAAAVADVTAAPSLVSVVLSSPASALATATIAWGLTVSGALAFRATRRSRPPLSTLSVYPRPVLIRDDGLVVDVVQRALQGNAQLLLFSQPLCGACERAQAVLDAEREALAELVDARIVYAVGHGVDWNGPARAADGPHTPAALDTAGLLAHALDVGPERPVAVLIGTNGQPVLPYAEGADAVAELVGVLVASRTG